MTLNRNDISDRLAAVGYVADGDIATALWLMEYLKRPLLLEGEAGGVHTNASRPLANMGSGGQTWPAPVNRLVRRAYATPMANQRRRVAG